MTKSEQAIKAIKSVGGIVRTQGNPTNIPFTVSPDTTTDVLGDSFQSPLPEGARLVKTGRNQFEVRIK